MLFITNKCHLFVKILVLPPSEIRLQIIKYYSIYPHLKNIFICIIWNLLNYLIFYLFNLLIFYKK